MSPSRSATHSPEEIKGKIGWLSIFGDIRVCICFVEYVKFLLLSNILEAGTHSMWAHESQTCQRQVRLTVQLLYLYVCT